MNRTVSHWMTTGLRHARPDDPLFRGLELMAEQGIRHVLVMQDDQLRGIVSNRDVIRATSKSEDGRLDLHNTSLGDVMTPMPLHAVTPETTLSEAAGVMHHQRISALPVLKGDGVAGLITTDDILAWVSLSGSHARPDL